MELSSHINVALLRLKLGVGEHDLGVLGVVLQASLKQDL
jgi:hypothetical protein